MTRQTPTETIIFQRNLAKIDRRIQRPNLQEDEKRELWDLRKMLFNKEVDDLDQCLRAWDRHLRQRGYRANDQE